MQFIINVSGKRSIHALTGRGVKIGNLHLLQELIIQNFAAKKGTAMEHHPEPPLEELQWTIAMARLIFGPTMNIQAPPNLTPGRESDLVLLSMRDHVVASIHVLHQ